MKPSSPYLISFVLGAVFAPPPSSWTPTAGSCTPSPASSGPSGSPQPSAAPAVAVRSTCSVTTRSVRGRGAWLIWGTGA